jgi:hypothetical protein
VATERTSIAAMWRGLVASQASGSKPLRADSARARNPEAAKLDDFAAFDILRVFPGICGAARSSRGSALGASCQSRCTRIFFPSAAG